MRFSLAQMVRRDRPGFRRKAVTLASPEPSRAQRQPRAEALVAPVDAWARAVSALVLPAYPEEPTVRLDASLRDAPADDLEEAIRQGDASALRVLLEIGSRLGVWVREVELWHRRRTQGTIRSMLGIDVSLLLAPHDVEQVIQAALRRNVALVRSVSDRTRDDISEVVYRGLVNQTPRREMAKEIAERVAINRRRALRIAVDQTTKLSASLDQSRQEQMEISEFMWQHSRKAHPREQHVARDGNVYPWHGEKTPADLPGQLPFCGCRARPHLTF